MKTLIVTGLTLVAGTLGTLAPINSAQAFSAQNFHGNICQPNSEILDGIQYTDIGIKALRKVTIRCPLATVSRNVTAIGVNVKDTALFSTACAIHPVGFTGGFQGNPLTFVIPQGQHSVNVQIPDSSKGPTTVYSVSCKLPEGQTLTGINVTLPE